MTNKQIQEMVNVEQWALWLRFVKKNNVKNEGGRWPDYDFHEFYTNLLNCTTEVFDETVSQGRSDSKGSEPVVPSDVPEGHGIGDQVELHPHDHVPGRRDSYVNELPLQESSDGPKDFGPASEPPFRLPSSPEGGAGK